MSLRGHIKSLVQSFVVVFPYMSSREPRYQECTIDVSVWKEGDQIDSPYLKSRGFLNNDLEVCTGCNDCIEVCPTKALTMETRMLLNGSISVDRFNIDLGRCTFCAICVEVCPVGSIVHTRSCGAVVREKEDLLVKLDFFTTKEDDPAEKIRKKIRMIRSYEVRR